MKEPESDELSTLFSREKLPSLLGSKGFIDWVKESFPDLRSRSEIPASRLFAPGLEAIQSAVCESYGIDPGELLVSRRGESNDPRNVAIYLARRLSGQTLTAIGKAFGLDKCSSVSSVVTRMKRRIQKDRRLRRRVQVIEKKLKMSQE